MITPQEYFEKGNELFKSKKCEAAIEYYTKALDAGISINWLPVAFSNRGSCYVNLGQYEKAIEDYSESIKLASADASDYKRRAHCYLLLEQYENAIGDLTRVIEIKPDSTTYLKRSMCYYLCTTFERNKDNFVKMIKDFYYAYSMDENETKNTIKYIPNNDLKEMYASFINFFDSIIDKNLENEEDKIKQLESVLDLMDENYQIDFSKLEDV